MPDPAPHPGRSDWTVQAADAIENAVDAVRGKTTEPVVGVARWIVYGTLVAIVTLVAATVMVIGLIRVLDVVLPRDVWLVYVILGGIFTVAGLLLWSKRRPRSAS